MRTHVEESGQLAYVSTTFQTAVSWLAFLEPSDLWNHLTLAVFFCFVNKKQWAGLQEKRPVDRKRTRLVLFGLKRSRGVSYNGPPLSLARLPALNPKLSLLYPELALTAGGWFSSDLLVVELSVFRVVWISIYRRLFWCFCRSFFQPISLKRASPLMMSCLSLILASMSALNCFVTCMQITTSYFLDWNMLQIRNYSLLYENETCLSYFPSELKWSCLRHTTTWQTMRLYGLQGRTWNKGAAAQVEWGRDLLSTSAVEHALQGKLEGSQ